METAVLAATKEILTFAEMRHRAFESGPRRIGIVDADEDVVLHAASDALLLGLASPVLIGDEKHIRARVRSLGLVELADRAEFVATANAAESAVRMAREGALDILMKGHIRTDQLFHPVLNRESGLRTGHLLCDVAIFEYRGEEGRRLIGVSDGGINVAPSLEQKKQIILGAIDVLHSLGIAQPRIAIMSALEVVIDSMPSTKEAAMLAGMAAAGEFGSAEVYGPLALDNALFEWAARAKGISHPVAGHADCLVVPNIEAGNLLVKSILFLAGWPFAHVIAGARVPILIPSRSESAHDKVNSIALGVLYAAR